MAPPLRRAKTEAAKKKAKASKSESMPERGDFRLHQSDTNRPLAQNLTRPAWAVPLKLDCSPAYCNCTVRRIESFAEPAPHIQELSFSHSGRAFEHPPGFDNGPIFLNARPINSKACKRILQAEPPEDCPKLRVSISLTEKEKQQNPPPGASKYLLVGWVLPDFKAKDGKAGHGAIVGNQRPPEDEITVFDADDTDNIPLMAVVEVTNDQDETKTSTYVLLHQQDDLCTPYIVGADEVYYLPLFRDNTTAKISRKRNWNIMVAKHSVVPSDEIEMTKQPALQCTRDQAKLLAEVVDIEDKFAKMLLGSAGDQALGMTYQDIWHHYCEQSDTDGARAAFMDVVKLNVIAFRHKNDHIKRTVEDMIEILEKLNL